MSAEIENVLVFVSDALRWDHLPDEVASKGVVFKTVAQGCKTAISFPTLATGLRPQQHGVSSWEHRLPDDVFSIFQSRSMHTAFSNSGPSAGQICPIIGADKEQDLSEVDPPFFYMKRDSKPHAPYADEFSNLERYFQDRNNDINQIREDYQQAVERSQALFESLLDDLRNRDVLDDTLVVFTSDHGELFGEQGELGHGAPVCPELVYVPTVFFHPDLSMEDFHVDNKKEIIEHVDITKTVLSAIDHDARGMVGTDLLVEERSRPFGYCYSKESHRGKTLYEANSVWWKDGGYVFTENQWYERLIYIIGHAYKANRRRYLRQNLPTVLRAYFPSTQSFGSPPIEKEEAWELMSDLLESGSQQDTVERELGDDARETLKQLGYLQ